MHKLILPPKTMPNLNIFRILSLVWKRRNISRIEVAAELGLTKSTVTKITGQLLDDGLLLERPVAKAEGRGRPRVALQLNASRGLVLGLEVRTDGWSSVLVHFDGTVARRDGGSRTWSGANLSQDLGELLSRLCADPPHDIPVLGAGLALPGIVDAREGRLLRSNPLDIQTPIDLRSDLQALLGLPVAIENDANSGCWGELAFGAGPLPGPFLFLLCEDRLHRSTGNSQVRVAALGFGLVLGGKPWWGPDHSAGEFSSVFKDGSAGLSFQFHLGDAPMAQVFQDRRQEAKLVEELGRNVAMLVNFLNLKAVYLSWPSAGDGQAACRKIAELIESNWGYPTPVGCQVGPPTGGTDAVAWGAAGYFLENLWGDSSFEEAQPRWK